MFKSNVRLLFQYADLYFELFLFCFLNQYFFGGLTAIYFFTYITNILHVLSISFNFQFNGIRNYCYFNELNPGFSINNQSSS